MCVTRWAARSPRTASSSCLNCNSSFPQRIRRIALAHVKSNGKVGWGTAHARTHSSPWVGWVPWGSRASCRCARLGHRAESYLCVGGSSGFSTPCKFLCQPRQATTRNSLLRNEQHPSVALLILTSFLVYGLAYFQRPDPVQPPLCSIHLIITRCVCPCPLTPQGGELLSGPLFDRPSPICPTADLPECLW